MIDLKKVKVTALMLREWKKARGKDPLTMTDMDFDDIAYAYYLMAKQQNPKITEDEALDDLGTDQILLVASAFFPALATPKKILDQIANRGS